MSVMRWFLVGQAFSLFPQNKIQDEQVQIYSMKILLFLFKNQTVIKDRDRELNGKTQLKTVNNNLF